MRYHVLVSYDISDPKRLSTVHRLMKGYGDGFQYSVFICQLSEKDFAILREKLHDTINHRQDQIVMIKLSPVSDSREFDQKWTVIGKKLIKTDSKRNFIY
jgi:CRISPR-associated protein Cas2